MRGDKGQPRRHCAPDPPSCACGSSLGGFVTDPGACPRDGVCDMPPADHHYAVDEHGCGFYSVPRMPTVCACLCRPPVDAGVSDLAPAVHDAD